MELNLLPIINADGEKLDIDEELDFSDRKEDGVIFLSPVEVCGRVVNISGTLELTAKVRTRLGFKCDRCCEDFTYDMSFEMSELLKKEAVGESAENENPDIIFFTGNGIELDGVVENNIFMNLPAKRLCKADCKGLCPKCGKNLNFGECGKNLNFGECGCDTRTADPRFDILDSFLTTE